MVTWSDERRLDEADLQEDPHRQFELWLQEAIAAGEPMPKAMALATASPEGLPSVRMILLEDVDQHGLTFQTNLESPKALDLAAVPHAAGVFFWPSLLRQVRVSGSVEPLSREEVGAYFAEEPRAIQAMLRACRQSQVVADRATLERGFDQALASAEEGVPDHWGGYRLHIAAIEFWQGRQNWLQDRLRYTRRAEGGWRIERLAP
jgi:pyridoxamine 5'-phosphate oxidase